MLITDKIHKQSSLMTSKKKDLVEHIMLIEHNNKVLQDTLDQQAENFKKLCEDCPRKKAEINVKVTGKPDVEKLRKDIEAKKERCFA